MCVFDGLFVCAVACTADPAARVDCASHAADCAAEYRPESYPDEPDLTDLPAMPTDEELSQPPPKRAGKTCSKRR